MLAGLIGFSLVLLYINTLLARGVDEVTPEEAKLILKDAPEEVRCAKATGSYGDLNGIK